MSLSELVDKYLKTPTDYDSENSRSVYQQPRISYMGVYQPDLLCFPIGRRGDSTIWVDRTREKNWGKIKSRHLIRQSGRPLVIRKRIYFVLEISCNGPEVQISWGGGAQFPWNFQHFSKNSYFIRASFGRSTFPGSIQAFRAPQISCERQNFLQPLPDQSPLARQL